MPFKNPQNSLTLPDGATTGPRIVLGTDIPAALQAAYGASLVISAAIVEYYSTSDFYFEALGIDGSSKPTLARGALIGGTLLRYEQYQGGNVVDGSIVSYGSAGNPGGTNWVYRNGAIVLTKAVGKEVTLSQNNIGSIGTTDFAPASPIGVSQVNVNQIASNVVTEVCFPDAQYTNHELTTDFEDGHYFKVTLDCLCGNNAFAANTGLITIRHSVAGVSTTGTIVAQWVPDIPSPTGTTRHFEGYFRNATGANKLGEILSICFHRNTGAGIVALSGTAANPLQMCVYDLGAQVSPGLATLVRDMT